MDELKKMELIGIVFTIIFGTLLHFTYDWSGNSVIVSLFSPVNESIWEHLKLLFFPYIVYSIFEYFYVGSKYNNYATAKILGVISGLIAIPVIFYLYTSLIENNLVLDILTFIVSVIISYVVSYYLLKNQSIEFNGSSIAIVLFIMFLFFAFTYNPPKTELFLDPITNTYGISQ